MAGGVHGQSSPVRLWTLGAGVGAALASWLLIEATLDTFKPATLARRFVGSTFMFAGSRERATAQTRNAALASGRQRWEPPRPSAGFGGWARGYLCERRREQRFWAWGVGVAAGAGASQAALPVASGSTNAIQEVCRPR